MEISTSDRDGLPNTGAAFPESVQAAAHSDPCHLSHGRHAITGVHRRYDRSANAVLPASVARRRRWCSGIPGTASDHDDVPPIRMSKHLIERRESTLEVADPTSRRREESVNKPFAVHTLPSSGEGFRHRAICWQPIEDFPTCGIRHLVCPTSGS